MSFLQALVLILVCFCLEFCICRDTISSTQSITDPETLVSNGTIFKLGFFSPANTTHRYLGILYNIDTTTAVWVANRDKPLNDSLGTVTISDDGNLVVLDGRNDIIWSTNVSNSMANSSAQLVDTGNLVLRDNSNGRTLWESFENPTDSFLERMRISTSINRDENNFMTSWKSPSDPSIGSFSAGIDPLSVQEIFIWNDSKPYWRSGPWNGQVFIGIPSMNSVYINGFNLVDNREGSVSLSYRYANESVLIYFALNSEGNLLEKYWYEGKEDWEITWMALENECDVYGKCGPFGSCYSKDSPICSCLKGFEPNNMEEWSSGNWTSGCARRTQLQCDRNSSTGKEDGFLKLTAMKVPDFSEWSNVEEDNCGSQCLSNCSCIAYSYYSGIGCMQWNGTLIDTQQFSDGHGVDLYIRVAYSDLEKKRSMKVVIAITVIIGSIAIAICSYLSWKCIAKRKGRKLESELSLSTGGEIYKGYSYENTARDTVKHVKLEELPLFTFETLTNATGNFPSANKLGRGGFGSVYKGKLPNGQEIAVKRLSRSSGQGLEEFMNEVVVTSKLQHRNLVRLLGCCVEGEEKMLIYEYMSKRSLDALLFDQHKKEQLDWSKRVNIIEGIGRGLLYLHRDSRLRIIHRDLKASNILLDEELNPKISDFGMARIFGGNQRQANTRRVVGTYGYMAPEYAMEGRFSEKSDVFSFGVLLLEILSGRKNTSFYDHEHALSLLGFAWKLWNEEKALELTDPRISDPCFEMEILRYIHVGLLCVQEFAKDRPTVSIVLSMLSSEIADLPTPKQPAFTERQTSSEMESPQLTQQKYSLNNVTVTIVEGR